MNNILINSIVVIVLYSINLFAQSNDEEQFNYAMSLFEKEKYFDAVTEFKRLLFFSDDQQYKFDANYYTGLSYKNGAKFSDAIRYLTTAEINAKTDKQIYNSRIQIIRTNILRKTTKRALSLLASLEEDKKYSVKKDEINYWRGWAYMFQDDWESASRSFAMIDENHDLKFLADSVDEKQYSVTFAKTISYLLPGAGQFYTGEYVSGLLSLGWNLLWGYLTINSFLNDRAFDGIMIGGLLWFRFYRGNFQNAEKFALEKNLIISNDAMQYLQNSYDGLKP